MSVFYVVKLMAGHTLVLIPEKCPGFDDIVRVIEGKADIVVSENVYKKLEHARDTYENEAKRKRIYGYCTGLGGRWNAHGECGPEWEAKIVSEHARGAGPPADPLIVRAFMAARIVQASRAYAPLRPETLERMVRAFNEGLVPQIPLHGSLGASGDLVPSAYMVQCVYQGKGWAHTDPGSPPIPCSEALERLGLEPEYRLEPGEALALINNTSWTSGIVFASLAKLDKVMSRISEVVDRLLNITGCVEEEFDVNNLGAKRVLPENLINQLSRVTCKQVDRLQDPYSIRCLGHILAAPMLLYNNLKELVREEICSPGENPIVVNGKVYHGCHFYAGVLGVYADSLAIAIAHIVNLIERLSSIILDSRVTGLPDFLASNDSPVGEMISQYTLASLTARARTLASPASIHSIPTSGGQEDIVPQSAESALKLWEQVGILSDALSVLENVIQRAETGFFKPE